MLTDTSPEAQRVWDELWRQATPDQRLQHALRMTNWAIAVSRRGLAEAHPELSEQERNLLWAEIHYGRDLAQRVRAHLKQR